VRLRDLRPRLGEGATQVRTQSDEWQPATAVAQRHHHRHLRAPPEVLPRLLVGARGDEHLVDWHYHVLEKLKLGPTPVDRVADLHGRPRRPVPRLARVLSVVAAAVQRRVHRRVVVALLQEISRD